MNTSVKLIILGLLTEKDMHPYEIQQTLRDREMDKQIRFQKGSLYYAVEQLHKNGFIDIAGVLKECNRPEKTVYHINESGRAEFQTLMKKNFLNLEIPFSPVFPALGFAQPADSSLVLELLDQRLEKLQERLAQAKKKYEEHIPTVLRAKLYIFSAAVEQTQSEIRWLEAIKKDALEERLAERGIGINLDIS